MPVALLQFEIEGTLPRIPNDPPSASSPIRCTSTPTSRRSPTMSGPPVVLEQQWPALDGAGRASAWATLAGHFRRPGALPARHAAPDQPRPRQRAASVPDRPARQLVGAGGRGHHPRALGDRVQDTFEVFRIWSDQVPDRLAASPSPDELETPLHRGRCPRPHVQGAFLGRSIPAQLKAGMLLTVRDSMASAARWRAG